MIKGKSEMCSRVWASLEGEAPGMASVGLALERHG